MRHRIAAALLAGSAVVWVGCGGGSDAGATADATPTGAPTPGMPAGAEATSAPGGQPSAQSLAAMHGSAGAPGSSSPSSSPGMQSADSMSAMHAAPNSAPGAGPAASANMEMPLGAEAAPAGAGPALSSAPSGTPSAHGAPSAAPGYAGPAGTPSGHGAPTSAPGYGGVGPAGTPSAHGAGRITPGREGEESVGDTAPLGTFAPGTSAPPGASSPGVPGAEGYAGGVSPGGAPGSADARPTTLDGLAKLAFQQRRERDAFQYLYAWGLTSDAGASEILSSYQWVSGLRRPAIAVRWGVGLQLTQPPNFNGSAAPIGQEQALGGRGTKREGGGGGSGGGSFPGGGSIGGGEAASNNEITRYAGELGQKILAEFQTRVADGRFGKALQEAPAGDATGGGGGPYGGGDSGGGFAGAGFAGAGSAPGALGVGGFRGGEGGQPAGGAPNNVTHQLTAGLAFLGAASEKDLIEKAKENSIDVLAVFRVKIQINKSGFIINETELALIDAAKGGKPLYETTPLQNTKVQQARMQNKDDGVDKEVKQLFDFIDKNLVVSPLPEALTADIVKTKRVDALVKAQYKNPLPVLAEIRFYHRNKLLSDADTVAAISQIIASDSAAKTLVDGKEEDRKKAIEKWIPKG